MIVKEVRDPPLQCFTKPIWFEGMKGEEGYNLHGRAYIERSLVIFAAIDDHVCEKVITGLLGG